MRNIETATKVTIHNMNICMICTCVYQVPVPLHACRPTNDHNKMLTSKVAIQELLESILLLVLCCLNEHKIVNYKCFPSLVDIIKMAVLRCMCNQQRYCMVYVSMVSETCTQPKEVGPCYANMPRFYYDPSEGLCIEFVYGGCKGNDNNFLTMEDCTQRCGGRAPVTQAPTGAKFSKNVLLLVKFDASFFCL